MFTKLSNGFNSIIKKVKVKELSAKELDPLITELSNKMIENDVAQKTAIAIGKELKKAYLNLEVARFGNNTNKMLETALQQALINILNQSQANYFDIIKKAEEIKKENRPMIICMLGINGTGKTTTLAKLSHLFQKNGFSVVMAASDTYRAGSIQQLNNHAQKLGIKLISQDYNADPTAVAIDAIDHAEAKGINIVIIDTAGRMQNNVNLVRELEKIMRLTEPDIKIFVGDSLAGNDVVRQAEQFNNDIGIDAVIMTKIDSDAKGGAILSVAHTIQKPIIFLGNGQRYDDLIEFNPQYIVKQIIP